ncbi:MAG: hypothetical protein AAFU66_11075 [Pseudomonadota bacterium]
MQLLNLRRCAAGELLRAVHAQGVTLFDSTRSYGPEGSEKGLGKVLGNTDAVFATMGGVA